MVRLKETDRPRIHGLLTDKINGSGTSRQYPEGNYTLACALAHTVIAESTYSSNSFCVKVNVAEIADGYISSSVNFTSCLAT